jgi:hypothetical protein
MRRLRISVQVKSANRVFVFRKLEMDFHQSGDRTVLNAAGNIGALLKHQCRSFDARVFELRQRLIEIIGKKRHAKQI